MKRFNVGDLVMITYSPMAGDLGIIIKQGTDPVDGPGAKMLHGADWLVHLTSGREIWLMTSELTNV